MIFRDCEDTVEKVKSSKRRILYLKNSSGTQGIKRKKRPDNLRPHLIHHEPETAEQDFAKVAGGTVLKIQNFMKVEEDDHFWIRDIFYKHFSRGLSEICDTDFLKERYDAFIKKENPIYLELLNGMKDESLSKTFVSYWTIAQTLATRSRFWIEDAIAEVLIRLAKQNEKNDLLIYSQSMLSDGWREKGISIADIGEEQLEHLSGRRPWRVSMQKRTLETIDVIVGEQEREWVTREVVSKRQWAKIGNNEIMKNDQKCLERVAKSLSGPPVSEITLQCNLLVIEPNLSDSKPHAWAFRFINAKTISSHPSRKQERVNLLRLYAYIVQEKILRNSSQMNVYVAELLHRKDSSYEGYDRYPDYFSCLTYWSSEKLWDFIGVPFELVTEAIQIVSEEFRKQLIAGLRNLLPKE